MINTIVRTAALLVDPPGAWTRVEKEPGDVISLLSGYVAVLGLIPALSRFIGASLIGVIVRGGEVVREPIFDGMFSAIFGYVATFAQVLLVALLIDVLAPRFGSDVLPARSVLQPIRLRRCGSPEFFCCSRGCASSALPASTASIFWPWACRS